MASSKGPEATSPVDRPGDVPPPLLEELRGDAPTIVAVAEGRRDVVIASRTPSRFDAMKTSLSTAPVLMLADHTNPFHVVCDASDYATGCALMQFDDEGRERVASYQRRQLKPAGRNYPVHDKELLAMHYALIKYHVYLLGEQTFAVYTDHASLQTATKSPILSPRTAHRLLLFAKYNFVVRYKSSKTNILADALSRRPDYVQSGRYAIGDEYDDECGVCVAEGVAAVEVTATSPLCDSIASTYEADASCSEEIKYLSDTTRRRLSPRSRARIDRYALDGIPLA